MNDQKNFVQTTQPQETKNVLVISDLADNVKDQDLTIFFEKFKESIIVIQYNRTRGDIVGGKSNSATVIFKEFKEAERAKYELNMRKLKGKTVRITWHERDSSIRYNNQANIYVKSIPAQVTAREFYEYFCTFGEVISAKLVEDDEGNHIGYGYVHFANIESKNKCTEASDNKEIWPGSKLRIENFQKKQERGAEAVNPNKSIFMKNFPTDFDEKKLKELIGKIKTVWLKMMTDSKGRKYAIVILDKEEDVPLIKELNQKIINGQELYVDNLMNKIDRKRYLTSKINDQNMQLTRKFRDCNLHIRNLPDSFKEEDLKMICSQYGEIKSVKVPTTTTVTKVKGEYVETETSCCYGFVCFTSPDSAKAASEDLNGKTLEGAKRPLILSYFMPKNERNQALNTAFHKKNVGYEGYGMNQQFVSDMMYGKTSIRQFPSNMMPYQQQPVINPKQSTQPPKTTVVQPVLSVNEPIQLDKKIIEEPDYRLLKDMEDDISKKDYLGEFIFRKIESHTFTEKHNLTMDHIGKITGMILGIEDVNEIIDICKNYDHLTSRILEALNLLNTTG